MIGRIEHASYLSNEQRQHVLALLASLPLGCTCTTDQVFPCGHFGFTVEGPANLIADVRKLLIEIIGYETPGLRSYTLQEAYNTFGWRSYTNVMYKATTGCFISFNDPRGFKCPMSSHEMVIDGIVISSGQVKVRIAQELGSSAHTYFTLDELARDFEWPNGGPCGVVVPSKSIQKRHEATGAKYRIGFD